MQKPSLPQKLIKTSHTKGTIFSIGKCIIIVVQKFDSKINIWGAKEYRMEDGTRKNYFNPLHYLANHQMVFSEVLICNNIML